MAGELIPLWEPYLNTLEEKPSRLITRVASDPQLEAKLRREVLFGSATPLTKDFFILLNKTINQAHLDQPLSSGDLLSREQLRPILVDYNCLSDAVTNLVCELAVVSDVFPRVEGSRYVSGKDIADGIYNYARRNMDFYSEGNRSFWYQDKHITIPDGLSFRPVERSWQLEGVYLFSRIVRRLTPASLEASNTSAFIGEPTLRDVLAEICAKSLALEGGSSVYISSMAAESHCLIGLTHPKDQYKIELATHHFGWAHSLGISNVRQLTYLVLRQIVDKDIDAANKAKLRVSLEREIAKTVDSILAARSEGIRQASTNKLQKMAQKLNNRRL